MKIKLLGRGRNLALLSAVVLLVSAGRSHAAAVTNQIIGVKFGEALNRVVKFVHAGPLLGHWAEFDDKGAHNLAFQLPLDGVDLTKFTDASTLVVSFQTSAGTKVLDLILADDPKYVTGGTKAKIVTTVPYHGKDVRTVQSSLKLNLAALTLAVKIKGLYLNIQRSNGSPDAVGQTLVAGTMLGAASGTFADTTLLTVEFHDPTTGESVVGSTALPFVGVVRTSSVTDPEIGTFNRSTVGVGGPATP